MSEANARTWSVPPAIHPTAIVDPRAELGRGVSVGPFSVVGPNVVLGEGCTVHAHVVIEGHTAFGPGVEVFPQAVIGMAPQDRKFDGGITRLRVGARTVLREAVTVHPGSRGAEPVTVIGSDGLIMAYCHIAHDCRIGDRVVMANASQIAGHCVIEDGAVLGGVTTVHQHCRIGTGAMTGASSRIQQDVPPFCVADGNPARLCGLNLVGLRRDGRSPRAIAALKQAYRALFRQDRYAAALADLAAAPPSEEVRQLCAFLEQSARGVARARRRR